MITKAGIYHDMPIEQYHGDPWDEPSFSQSIGKILLEQSPAHARLAHPRLCPPEEKEPETYNKARAIGDAVHAALLGRGKHIVEGNFEDWRKAEAKALRDQAIASGCVPILSKHLELAHGMIKAASYQLDAAGHADAFRKGHGEVVLAWIEDGLRMRAMIDWMVDTTRIYDAKTTSMSCAPHVVVDRPSVEGWDIQAAMHERGLDALDPDNAGRRKFFYVNQENEPPYALTVVEISRHDLDLGRSKLEHAVEIWRRCITTNTWPLYPAETVISHPRGWTETKWAERALEHKDRERYKRPIDSLMGG